MLEADQDPEIDDNNECATRSDLHESQWITDILEEEPFEKLYSRREDFRVGGYRNGPFKLIKSFQKQ